MIALFVVGSPGVGKTTLVRLMLQPAEERRILQAPKFTVCGRTVAAGHYTGATFDGADTVPYNGALPALDFFQQALKRKCDLAIFDGDRFSNANCLARLQKMKRTTVACVHLVANDECIAERCAERGSEQNATWLKGRVTKAKNFAARVDPCLELDATKAPEELYEELRLWLRTLEGDA